MNKENFWRDAARSSVAVGLLLAFSAVLENLIVTSGSLTLYGWMVVEFILAAVLHYWLLNSAVRSRAACYPAEEGFRFGQGYGFVLAISALAGVVVGVVQVIYLHAIVGYEAYIEKYIASVGKIVAMSGGITSSTEGLLTDLIARMQSTPAPSIFSTLLSGIWGSLLFGLVFGLIIAGVHSRAPQPFAAEANDNASEADE